MIEPVCLGLPILDLKKTVMHEFLYDYVKLKYCENEKFCYIDTDSFNDHVKSDDNYKDIAEDIYTSNFEIDRPLPKVKKKDCANER